MCSLVASGTLEQRTPYPVHSVIPLMATWAMHQLPHMQACGVLSVDLATVVLQNFKKFRGTRTRVALIYLVVVSLEASGTPTAEHWRELLQVCSTTLSSVSSNAALRQTMMNLKSSVSSTLPKPVRLDRCCQKSLLPRDMPDADDTTVLRWLFGIVSP